MSVANLDELLEPYARGRVATERLHHPRRLRRVQRATNAGAQTYGRVEIRGAIGERNERCVDTNKAVDRPL